MNTPNTVLRGKSALVTGGIRTPFVLDHFRKIDSAILQAPAAVAEAVLQVLTMPPGNLIAELPVLPMGETSWP